MADADADGAARSTKRRRMDFLIQMSRNFAGVGEARGVPDEPVTAVASDDAVDKTGSVAATIAARKRTWTQNEDARLCELVARLGRNWAAIAVEFPTRDRKRVRERYVNYLDPALTHKPWSDDEDRRLMALQQELGSRWARIAQSLKGRSPDDAKNRWLRLIGKDDGHARKAHQSWTTAESDVLRTLVEANGAKDWFFIASQIPGRTDLQCRQHWHRVLAPKIVKGRSKWSHEEDSLLRAKVDELGHQWEAIAELLPGRMGKQCRERYLNHLRPGIDAGPWTNDEDNILRRAYQLNPARWSLITRQLPGRSENTIKNRWNSLRRSSLSEPQDG